MMMTIFSFEMNCIRLNGMIFEGGMNEWRSQALWVFKKASNLPMNRKNMSKPNSRIDALSVRPKICNPFECLDNLNIRNTRTKRITRNIAKDIAWFVDLSYRDRRKTRGCIRRKRVIKEKNVGNLKSFLESSFLATCGLTGALGRFNVSSSSATTVANVIK